MILIHVVGGRGRQKLYRLARKIFSPPTRENFPLTMEKIFGAELGAKFLESRGGGARPVPLYTPLKNYQEDPYYLIFCVGSLQITPKRNQNTAYQDFLYEGFVGPSRAKPPGVSL